MCSCIAHNLDWRGWTQTYSRFLLLSPPEIERVQKDEPEKDSETYLDLFTAKNIKLKERVLIPVKQYPKVGLAFWLNTFLCFSRATALDRSSITLYVGLHNYSDVRYLDLKTIQRHCYTHYCWLLDCEKVDALEKRNPSMMIRQR